MDPGCHRPALPSLRTSEIDHSIEGCCVSPWVVELEHECHQAGGLLPRWDAIGI